MNRLPPALIRASIAVFPLRVDGTSCTGMPWPLNRDEIHHQAQHDALWSSMTPQPGQCHRSFQLPDTCSSGHHHRMPALLLAHKTRVLSVWAFACSGYAAENLVASVHLRTSTRS